MKKVLSFVAVSAMLSLAACGGGEDEAKRKADSTKAADSVAAVEAAAKRKADSAHAADSVAAAEAARKADSARVADSIANAKPTGKPKTIQQKVKEEAVKATSGRG